jgi:hypothetical protein
MATVKYLNRVWNVAPRDEGGYVLTYAATPPPHLVGRSLVVTQVGVFECVRGQAGKVALMPKHGHPMRVDGPELFHRIAAVETGA